ERHALAEALAEGVAEGGVAHGALRGGEGLRGTGDEGHEGTGVEGEGGEGEGGRGDPRPPLPSLRERARSLPFRGPRISAGAVRVAPRRLIHRIALWLPAPSASTPPPRAASPPAWSCSS